MWSLTKLKLIDAVEQIQKSFTLKIDSLENLTYWDRLKKLEILSLQRRREKLIILHTWKIRNHIVPNNINLEFNENPRNLVVKAVLKPLPRVQGKLLSSFENSFVIKSAKLWNKLPPQLTEISNLKIFQNKLDKYLRLIPDKPPVHGIYHQTHNSILDYKIPSLESVFKN